MSEKLQNCPDCGQKLPSPAWEGPCPRCLLAGGLSDDDRTIAMPAGSRPQFPAERRENSPPASDSSGKPSTGTGAAAYAPSLEEMAELFPEFETVSLLGAGGMGAVYQVRQPRLDRFAALKILGCPPEHREGFALRFEREAQVLARLNHPNIVTIYDFGERNWNRKNGEAEMLFYFLMEFVDGADLAQLIRTKELTPEQALAIVPQICEALQFAHDEGITHRDIKPANILLDQKGQVKIADFGLAKLIEGEQDAIATGLTLSGTSMGTPYYMAPEQFDSPEKVDHRADIYSLGVVFYEMLTGDRPHGLFSPPSERVGVDDRIDTVVLKAMEKEPDNRYQQASEVGEDVTRVSADPIPDRKVRRSGSAGRWIAVAACVALLAGGAWWLGQRGTGDMSQNQKSRNISSVTEGSHTQNDSGGATTLGNTGPREVPTSVESTARVPGRLRIAGTTKSGEPFDLSAAEDIVDVVDVAVNSTAWMALRANGQVISSWDDFNRKKHSQVRSLEKGGKVAGCYIKENGDLVLPSFYDDQTLWPPEFANEPFVEVAHGSDHGIALTSLGNAVVFDFQRDASGKDANSAEANSTSRPHPPRELLVGVTAVETINDLVVIVRKDGSLVLWGPDGREDPGLLPPGIRFTAVQSYFNSRLLLQDDSGIVWNLAEGKYTRLGPGSIGSGGLWRNADGRWKTVPSEAAGRHKLEQLLDRNEIGNSPLVAAYIGEPEAEAALVWIEPAQKVDETFPPGQWTRVLTSREELDESLRGRAGAMKLDDGWVDASGEEGGPSLHFPKFDQQDMGVRLRGKVSDRDSIWLGMQIHLRTSKSDEGALVYTFGLEEMNRTTTPQLKVRLQNLDDQKPGEFLKKNLPDQLNAGDEFEMAFFAIGNRLIARFNGEYLPVTTDDTLTGGSIMIQNPHLIRDVEIINLDGFSEAEALEIAGPGGMDPMPAFETVTGPLHVEGVFVDGSEPDLSRAQGIDDFVHVILTAEHWIALRKNGSVVSSDDRGNGNTGVAKLLGGRFDSFGWIDEESRLTIVGDTTGEGFNYVSNGVRRIPEKIQEIGVVDAEWETDYAIARLRDGSARVWGERYSNPARNWSPAWPPPDPDVLSHVIDIATTNDTCAVIAVDGSLHVWADKGPLDVSQVAEEAPFRQIQTGWGVNDLLSADGRLLRVANDSDPLVLKGWSEQTEAGLVSRNSFFRKGQNAWELIEIGDSGVDSDRAGRLLTSLGNLAPDCFDLGFFGSKEEGKVFAAAWIGPELEVPKKNLDGADFDTTTKPGSLRGTGVFADGSPLDLSHVADINDFMDVVTTRSHWFALRANGDLMSSDGSGNIGNIAGFVSDPHPDRCTVLTRDGDIEFINYKDEPELPPIPRNATVADAAMGEEHGLVLTDEGEAIPFGARYESEVGDPSQPNGYGSPMWPPAPPGALRSVKIVAATLTSAATVHHGGKLTVWNWKGVVDFGFPAEFGNVTRVHSSHDSYLVGDDRGQVWLLPIPRNPHPDQPVGTGHPCRRLGLGKVGTNMHFWYEIAHGWKHEPSTNRPLTEWLDRYSFPEAWIIGGHESISEEDGRFQSYLIWIEPENSAWRNPDDKTDIE